jgi:thermolabile hemolysin
MGAGTFSKLVLFGDSDTDGGEGAHGVYELTNKSWPAPPHFKGRFCNGPVWPEYLAPRLEVLYNPEDNFAVGGAETGTTNIAKDKTFENSGILAQVRKYVHARPPAVAPTLFVIWGGGANFLEQEVSVTETVEGAVRDLEACVDLLKAAGARTILLGTQPSMGYSPEMRANNKESFFHHITAQFNDSLARSAERLRQDSSARIMLADIAGRVAEVLAAPQQFGFSNVTDSCFVDGAACAEPDSYLYWDNVHFTTSMHRLVAERFYEAVTAEYAQHS